MQTDKENVKVNPVQLIFTATKTIFSIIKLDNINLFNIIAYPTYAADLANIDVFDF